MKRMLTPAPLASKRLPPSLWLAIVVAAGLLTQLAAFQAYRGFFSEVYSSESADFSGRRLYARAHESALRALQMNPQNGYALFHLGSNLILQDRYADAAATLKHAERYMPHLPNLLRLLAQSLYFSGDYRGSAQAMERYFRMDPVPQITPERMLRLYAFALCRAQESGPAAIAFASAETFDESRKELLEARTANSLMLNQITSADYAFRRFRRLFPTQPLATAQLFSEVLAADKVPVAMRFIEVLWMRGETSLPLLKALVLSYMRTNRCSEALTLLKQAIPKHPTDADLQLYLGDVYYRMNNVRAAREAYRRHFQLAPNSPSKAEITKKLAGSL